MARFDLYHVRDGGLVVDCQADFLDDIATRFVVPLLPIGAGPPANARLNPVFGVGGERLVMTTQFAAAIRVRDLIGKAGSLEGEAYRITNALDVLTGTG